jgi:hypothetical protein
MWIQTGKLRVKGQASSMLPIAPHGSVIQNKYIHSNIYVYVHLNKYAGCPSRIILIFQPYILMGQGIAKKKKKTCGFLFLYEIERDRLSGFHVIR